MTTSDLGLGGGGPDVEVYVGAALAHAGGALDGKHLLAGLRLEDEPRCAEGPLLLHDPDHVARRGLNLQLL